MTSASIIQLYAPFVGLMALAFWMGVLSQRVRQLEKGNDAGSHLVSDMAVMKADLVHVKDSIDHLTGQLAWVVEPAPYSVRRKPPAQGGAE